jgi:hypothetical protein
MSIFANPKKVLKTGVFSHYDHIGNNLIFDLEKNMMLIFQILVRQL